MTEPRGPGRWLPEPGKVISTALHEQGAQFPNIGAMRVLEALREAGWELVKLPKPDDDQGDGIAFWTEQEVGVADGMVVARFDPGGNEAIYFDPAVAYAAAVALLAAARVVGATDAEL